MNERIAMLFPGQGIQHSGICKELYQNSKNARYIFHLANEILNENIVEKYIFGDENIPANIVQPFIVTASLAYYKTFIDNYGIKPSYVAGHSLGEYSALIAAGCIEFHDALELVKKRAALMNESFNTNAGSMVVVMGIDQSTIQNILTELIEIDEIHNIYIANINSPDQTVIAGFEKEIDHVIPYFENKGAVVVKLNVSVASHCPLLKEAASQMKNILEKVHFMQPQIPIISNVSAVPYTYEDIQNNLEQQLIKPVQWVETVKYLRKHNVDYFIDVGPGVVLKNLNIKNCSDLESCTYSLETDSEILRFIFSENVINRSYIEIIKMCYKTIICTKNYNQRSNYNENVVEPTRKIKKLFLKLIQDNQEPTEDEVKSVIDQTLKIMQFKGVPSKEIKDKLIVAL